VLNSPGVPLDAKLLRLVSATQPRSDCNNGVGGAILFGLVEAARKKLPIVVDIAAEMVKIAPSVR
jgi:hypothetical protein